MQRNYLNLAFTGIAAASILAAASSGLKAQVYSTPIRDRDHRFEKDVYNWKQLKEVHIVMQKRDYSCGAAALATILKYYWGDNVTEDQILLVIEKLLTPEEMRDRIKKGLAISDLRRAAVEMGYLSTIGTLTFQELAKSKAPLVVGISANGYDHFVVYRGIDYTYVYLADPIRGNIRLTHPVFVSQWQKNAALVVAKPDQEPPKTSPLSVRYYETELGELNNQLLRTLPPKAFTKPGN
jgi:predicted double-glycine peptidase